MSTPAAIEAPERPLTAFTAGTMPASVGAFYSNTARLSATVVAETRRLWATVDYADLAGSWAAIAPRLLELVSAAQLAAAGGAEAYLAACLGQLGIDGTALGVIVPSAFAASAPDGRSLLGSMETSVVKVKTATAVGLLSGPALDAGLASLVTVVSSTIEDTARQAVSVGMAARPAVTGYVRAVNAGACARCVILAGRFYRWSDGFARHPRCGCKNVPGDEKIAKDLVTDADAYVKNLPTAEKERILGKAGAKAVEDGANLNQIVNSRRGGVSTTRIYGRTVQTTTEGTTSRGMFGRMEGDLRAVRETDKVGRRVGYTRTNAPRLTPEAIYDVAENREDAVAILKRFGYITE